MPLWISPLVIRYTSVSDSEEFPPKERFGVRVAFDKRQLIRKPYTGVSPTLELIIDYCFTSASLFSCLQKREKNSFLLSICPPIHPATCSSIQQTTVHPHPEMLPMLARQTFRSSVWETGHKSSFEGWMRCRKHKPFKTVEDFTYGESSWHQ